MKPKTSLPFFILTLAFLFVTALWLDGTAAAAQHSERHPGQTTPNAESPMRSMMSGGMMSGGMMPQGMVLCQQMMSGTMMAQHQETAKLVNELLDSTSALEKESDPATLKTKLADHRALLEQLQTRIQQHSAMMQKMMEQMPQHPQMGTAPEQK